MTAKWWTCCACGESSCWEQGEPCPKCGAKDEPGFAWVDGDGNTPTPGPDFNEVDVYSETPEDVEDWLLAFYVRQVARFAALVHRDEVEDMKKARRYLDQLIDEKEGE